jgi:pimeloyl-ACP methyl ester carboxylesterase
MSAALSLVLFLAGGLAVAWAIVAARTAWIIGHPPRRTYAWAVSRGLPGDPSELPKPWRFMEWTYSNGAEIPSTTAVWTIEGEDPAGPVVIFSHGWGESKQAVLSRLSVLGPRCSKVIAWDLPGHGESSRGGSPLGTKEWQALQDLIEDAQGESLSERRATGKRLEQDLEDEADWDEHLRKPATPHAPRVILHGFSLGGGVCLETAEWVKGRVAAVIVEAPYRLPWTPAASVMRTRGFPTRGILLVATRLLGLGRSGPSWSGFDRANIAQAVTCPVLVVHGSADAICPIEDGRAIAAAAKRGRLEVIEGADHNDLWTTHAEATGRAIGAFLDELRGRA